MKMTIIEHWPEDTAFNGSPIPPRVKSPTTFEQSGWSSVKEMQKELMHRFPQRWSNEDNERDYVHDAELWPHDVRDAA